MSSLSATLQKLRAAGHSFADVRRAWGQLPPVGRVRRAEVERAEELSIRRAQVVDGLQSKSVKVLGLSTRHLYVEVDGVVQRISLKSGVSKEGTQLTRDEGLRFIELSRQNMSRLEELVLTTLSSAPLQFNAIWRKLGVPRPTAHKAIKGLVDRGAARRITGGFYAKVEDDDE